MKAILRGCSSLENLIVEQNMETISVDEIYEKNFFQAIDTYQKMKKHSIAAWLAFQIATLLGIDEARKKDLFYTVFINIPYRHAMNNQLRAVLEIAQSASDWIMEDACLEEKIRKYQFKDRTHAAVVNLVNEVKVDEEKSDITEEWQVYRDVIYASTLGKFLLIDQQEVEQYTCGNLLVEVPIQEKEDVPKSRAIAEQFLKEKEIDKSKIMSYKLIISEGVTNILKHANYGKMRLYEDQMLLRVVIEDKGSGLPLKLLPQTTLMAGFSTQNSLGHGFSLMLKIAKRVLMHTSSSGTTLILELDNHNTCYTSTSAIG